MKYRNLCIIVTIKPDVNVKNDESLSGLRLEHMADVEDSAQGTNDSSPSPSVRESVPEIGSLPLESSTPSLDERHRYSGCDEVSASMASSSIHSRQVCVAVLYHG